MKGKISADSSSSPGYSSYSRDSPHVSPTESGVGYGYDICRHCLRWHPLLTSNEGNDQDSLFLTKEMRARIRRATPENLAPLIAPEVLVWRRKYERVGGKLQADPDEYLRFLRTGIVPD